MSVCPDSSRFGATFGRRRGRLSSARAIALTWAAVILGTALPAHAGTDLPPATANLQTIPAGSLVIPMDSAKQKLNGKPFNLAAYGLVTQLLWDEIPVRWAIRAGKLKDEPDFTTTADRVFPSALPATSMAFSGGPFIILARDVAVATPIITAFARNVAVYRLTVDTTVDVRYTLLHKPKVALLDDGGNADIHEDILQAAGFTPGVQYAEISATTLTTINANSCFTMASEPHFSLASGGNADPQAQAIRAFALSGGNFLAQCAAIPTYENNQPFGLYQSTAGIVETNVTVAPFTYSSSDFSFSQFDGTLEDTGGSVQDFDLGASSTFHNGAHPHVLDSLLPGSYVATAAKLTGGLGSMVFYIGGHSYDDDSLSEINGLRMYLNAVLTPAARPAPCELNFEDAPTIKGWVYEDVDGNGDLTDRVIRPGVTVRLYHDGGDQSPSGSDDTIVASMTTDAAGSYSFENLSPDDRYWVAVDSKTIVPSASLNGGWAASDAWAEQTYGPSGARCDNGAGGVATLSAPGPCFAGKSRSSSDSFGGLGTSEHVALASPGRGGRRVEFAFSFATIATTRDGDDVGGGSARTIQGSVRQFLGNANAIAGTQRSMFRLAGATAPSIAWRVTPSSALPEIIDAVVLDGSTQTGFAGIPLVELDGSAGRPGLIVKSTGSTIRSLTINRFDGPGVTIDVNGSNRVEGCYIGTDAPGTAALGNGDVGVLVRSDGNTIGGTTAAQRNVISGNVRAGVKLDTGATANVVSGNFIGTNASGAGALGNGDVGVDVRATANTIGGAVAGAGNVISANANGGIKLTGGPATANSIQGNLIGTNAAGTAILGNVGPGIDVRSANGKIGGTVAAARNVIAGNTIGISITGNGATGNLIQGNLIGTNAVGAAALGNSQDGIVIDTAPNNTVGGTATGAGNVIANNGGDGVAVTRQPVGNIIRANSIYDNGGLGIDLEDDGVTLNDAGDADIGPNDLQNFPVLTDVTTSGGTTTITGTLNSTPSETFALDFFASNTFDPTNYGEGKRYLGSATTVTNTAGNATFTAVLSTAVVNGEVISATATAPDNSTSEFSRIFVFWPVTGTVSEDIDGDGDLADAVVRPAITVRLYRDGGDGQPTGVDDSLVATTTTNAAGIYTIQNILSGTYWAAVDSKTVTPSAAWNAGSSQSNVWAEQTVGPAGAQCDNGAGATSTLSTTGRCYGGRRSAVSDNTAALATSEHVARVVVLAAGVPNIDFAFSFRIVANTRDGDDDLSATRTIQGSLRQLVQNANALSGPGSSVFRIPQSDSGYNGTGNGEFRIRPTSPLPDIVDPLVLDGSTQPGWSTRPIVELNGNNAGNSANGLRVTAGGSTIRGLVVNQFRQSGIELSGAGGNLVEGCYIGATAGGTAALANSRYGVDILSAGNTIGGTTATAGNVISGNTLSGIRVSGAAATGNTIAGNRIGTNAAGTLAVRNSLHGVEIGAGASSNRIGGTVPRARNVVSGNDDNGVLITGAGANGTIVEGNYIGINAAGIAALSNGQSGVFVTTAASNTTIGGVAAGAGNVISGNADNGVEVSGNTAPGATVVQGNFIGTDATGSAAVGNSKIGVFVSSGVQHQVGGTSPGAGNTIAWNGKEGVAVNGNGTTCAIRRNSIHDNTQLGIDVRTTGVNGNDLNDGDTGPNDLQNFPVLTSVTNATSTTTIGGSLNSTPNATFTLEYFVSLAADATGHGEGRSYLGSTSVTTDGTGNAAFTTIFPTLIPTGHFVSATATSSGNKTSEFSGVRAATTQVDLSLTKSASNGNPTVGDTVTFTVTVTNAPGVAPASGVVVRDLLPAGYSYVSDDSASTATTYAPATGIWTVGNVAAGSSVALTLTAQVNASGPYLNAAEVTAASPTDIDSTPGDGAGDDYATASTSPVTPIDLSLAKSVDLATPPIGTNVVFTITVTNATGAGSATGIEVTDLLPAGYAYVGDDSASTGSTYVPATGLWTVGNLAPGTSATLHVTAQVLDGGPWNNFAEVTRADQPDIDSTPADGSGDDYASATTAPIAPIDLSLTKDVDNIAPSIGGTVVFRLTVSNATGFADASGVEVTDLLPSGYTYVSDDSASTATSYNPATGAWSVGNLAAGTSIGLKITAQVSAAGNHLNAAEVTAAAPFDVDSTPADGQGDDFAAMGTTPEAEIDLSLTKLVDVPVPLVGSNVTFTLTLANAPGEDPASGIVVQDLLPSGYSYVADNSASTGTSYASASGLWTVGNLSAGSSISLKLTARVLGTGTHVNSAEVVAAGEPDVDSTPADGSGDDYATAATAPALPTTDLSLAMTVSQPTPPTGSTILFTLTVTNADGFTPASGVVVTDILPSGYTYVSHDSAGATYDPASGLWTIGSLDEGTSAVLKITAIVNPAGTFVNAAEVTAAAEPDLDSVPGDGTGDDYAAVGTAPTPTIDLSLVKSVDTVSPAVGSNVVFTVTVANEAGLSGATGITVTDLLPAGYQYIGDDSATSGTTYAAATGVWTVGNLAAGGSRSLNLTAKVLPAGPYLNAAEVTAAVQSDLDSVPADGAGDDRATATISPSSIVDLSIAVEVDDPAPPVGGSVVFKVTVSNAAGWSDANGVEVVDVLPAGYSYATDDSATTGTTYAPATGLWTVGNLAGGASRSLKIRATVLPTGPWSNPAEVTAAAETDIDSVPGDGTGDDYANINVVAAPWIDLSLTKTVDIANPTVGSNVVFTLLLANAPGLSTATGVVVSDPLPSGYAYVSDDSALTGTTFDPSTGDWNVGSIVANTTIALHITATIGPTGNYSNIAEVVAASEPDLDSAPGNRANGEDDRATAAVAPLGTDGAVDITDTIFPGEILTVTVTDADLNLSASVAESGSALTVNGATGETESVTLTETGPNSGVFRGTAATAFGTTGGADGDGSFNVQAGNTITVTYDDARTATGGAAARTDAGNVVGGADATLSITPRSLPGEALVVTVTDADLNADPSSAETVQIAIVNDFTEEVETVTLTETGPNTGVFNGAMNTSGDDTAAPNDDGALQTRLGDTLTATYFDARTAAGGNATVIGASLVGGEVVRLAKTALKDRASIGDVVPFTINATSAIAAIGITVQDLIPAGFKYVEGSARLTRAGPDESLGTLDDTRSEIPTVGVRPVLFGPFDVAAGESVEVSYALRVGSGAGQGDHANVATPLLGGVGVGAAASANVTVVADPVFDQSTIIGKVYQDKNRNDWQDAGEDGVAQAMVVLDDGTYILTDEFGRFHFPATNPGQRMVKLNVTSLPLGSEITGEESRILWITPGVPVRADFGVIVPEPVEKTIGAPGAKGVAVSGTLEPTSIEVRGNVSDVTMLVNDTLVPLATSDVKLEVKQLGEIVRLVGNALPEPVSFRLRADANGTIERWTLHISDVSAQPVKSIAGTGALPEAIPWDATSDSGEMVMSGEIYRYQLELHYADGSTSRSAERIFGVNRETVLSLELTGDAFATGKAELTAGAQKTLDRAAEILQEYPREKVVIEGHTDNVGNPESNLELSKLRAESARDYLVGTRAVAAERLALRWFGEERPKVTNDTAEGRAVNRRVEIKGEVQRVESADLNARVRTEPFVYINNKPVSIAGEGRYAATVPGAGIESLEVEMANGQGRTVSQVVDLPDMKLALPQGEVVAHGAATPGHCVQAAGAGSDETPATLVCRIEGTTEPGNSVQLDGKPVAVAADGHFSSDVTIAKGKGTYPLIVRNPAGVSRGANLVMSLSDRDGSGKAVITSQAIPNLKLTLPPDGSRLPGRKLQIAGTTDPGNQVTANGQAIEVTADGRIQGAIELPPGHSRVVVEVKDPDGGTGRIESEYEVPKHELFMLALADGTFGKMSGSGLVEAAGQDADDDYYSEGRVAFYLKGVIAGKYLITSSFDSDRQSNGTVFQDLNGAEGTRLLTNLDPDRYYPVYGDDSTLVYDVESQGKFYLALDSDTMAAVVGNYPLALKDTELATYQRTLYGARYAYRSLSRSAYGDPDTSVVVFGAQVRQTHVRDEVRATGGSLYYLSHQDIVEGSEQVTLVVRDKNTGLFRSQQAQRQNLDYTIKYPEGRIMFRRPISSVVQGGSITDQNILSGDPVFIQIDYEAAVEGFEKTAEGVRARQQIGDHVAVGGTYVNDELQTGEYELEGVDTEVRLRKGTRLLAEYAKSSGTDALTYRSDDGGLSFTTIAANGMEEGSALKLSAEVDIGEWFNKPNRYHARFYYKDLEPGFFSNGNFQEQGTTKIGINADLTITDRDTLRVRYDQEERTSTAASLPGATSDTDLGAIQWEHRRERWGATGELFQSVVKDAQGNSLGDSSLAAARGWMKFTDKVSGTLEHQETLDGVANDQTTAGVQYQVLPSLALEARATDGSRGNSAEAGAVLTMGETNVYLTERAASDQAGDRTATVIGARSPIGANSRVYTEYQWEDTDAGENLISLLGLQRQWDLAPGLRVVASGENAHVKSSANAAPAGTPGSAERDRAAFAVGVSYEKPESWFVTSRNEIRFDDGVPGTSQPATGKRKQVLTYNQFSYKLNEDLRLIGKLAYSTTENTDTNLTEARLDEQSVGVAYRPVASDRLNALGRYTRLRDLRPAGAGLSLSSDRKLDVLSAETIFRITSRVEWAAKLAARMQREALAGLDPIETDTYLTIQRFNVNVWNPFDIGVEYRMLTQRQTDDQRRGFLGEFMWKPVKYFRVGLGYNFTDFSDDEFSSNDYSQTGWFIRVQGRY